MSVSPGAKCATAAPTISAALIVLNEEAHLRELLPQLAWCDEVLVVDGGSTDRSVAVARDLRARVIEHPFDQFAAQRNRAAQAATGDWVFSIDADERPQPGLADEIRTRIGSDRAEAWRLAIRSTIFGKRFRFSGTQDDRPIRLFRRGRAHWVGKVHEALLVEGRVRRLARGLEHETLPDVPAFLAKMNRYTHLTAEARVARGQVPRLRDRWFSPVLEVGRRLVWKAGILDGPAGWTFCWLSGLSQWVLAERHARYWNDRLAIGDSRRATIEPANHDFISPSVQGQEAAR